MQPATGDILELCDRLQHRGALDRAVGLVALFEAGDSAEEIEDWPVGRRDAAALAARARLLGEAIRATTPCPRCGTVVELSFTAADVSAPPATERADVTIGAERLTLRPVTTRDLRRALAAPDPRRALALACADGAGEAADLPAIAAGLQSLDPQADIRLSLGCAECGQTWDAPFDVTAFVWTELAAWARRRLHDVHVLASA